MLIFNADLDNTLIFSYRQHVKGEKLCVEMHQGKELSFMTCHSYELLGQVRQKLCFVPTTTRTMEQYKRIDLGGRVPEYALVCNGGILLVDGVPDESWYQESLGLVSEALGEMTQAKNLLQKDKYRSFEIREPDGLFLFTKSSQPEKTVKELIEGLDMDKVGIFLNGSKIYVIPKRLNKGEAVLRLKRKLKGDYVVAAGDSLLDVPMLEAADRAFVPAELATRVQNRGHISVFHDEGDYSDFVLESVLKEIDEIQ